MNKDPRLGSIQNVLRKMPSDPAERKAIPIFTGLFDYFPDALIEIARVSKAGNDQHNPGQPLHWARGKSVDHADTAGRHMIERGTRDTDGQRHSAKAAWRVIAMLQEEIEAENGWNAETAAPAEAGAAELYYLVYQEDGQDKAYDRGGRFGETFYRDKHTDRPRAKFTFVQAGTRVAEAIEHYHAQGRPRFSVFSERAI